VRPSTRPLRGLLRMTCICDAASFHVMVSSAKRVSNHAPFVGVPA